MKERHHGAEATCFPPSGPLHQSVPVAVAHVVNEKGKDQACEKKIRLSKELGECSIL